jgi:serine/threonine protein phosphatase PrpC
MTDSALADLIAEQLGGGVEGLPRRLVEEALARGTTDNTTVLVYEHQPQEGQLVHLNQTVTGAYPSELAMVFQRLS